MKSPVFVLHIPEKISAEEMKRAEATLRQKLRAWGHDGAEVLAFDGGWHFGPLEQPPPIQEVDEAPIPGTCAVQALLSGDEPEPVNHWGP